MILSFKVVKIVQNHIIYTWKTFILSKESKYYFYYDFFNLFSWTWFYLIFFKQIFSYTGGWVTRNSVEKYWLKILLFSGTFVANFLSLREEEVNQAPTTRCNSSNQKYIQMLLPPQVVRQDAWIILKEND